MVGVAETCPRASKRLRIVWDSFLRVEMRVAECVRLEERAATRETMRAKKFAVLESILDLERRDMREGAVSVRQ